LTAQILLPPDIQPAWLNVIRRLQCAASENNRNKQPALISIVIAVDQYGCPRIWTEPKTTRLEPSQKSCDRLNELERDLET
jgi:hypothetical protein